MKKIYVATTNKGKLKEIQEILNIQVESVEIEIDEVQSTDLEYVARKKAEAAFTQLKKPVIVDDVGVYIEAWNGFPGPFVKHMFDSIEYDDFLKIFSTIKNRTVKTATAIAYHDGNNAHVFLGEFKGKIAFEKKGTNGFGFDSIVIPDGYSQTYAEMKPEIKNMMSSRSQALAKLKKFLDGQKKQKKI